MTTQTDGNRSTQLWTLSRPPSALHLVYMSLHSLALFCSLQSGQVRSGQVAPVSDMTDRQTPDTHIHRHRQTVPEQSYTDYTTSCYVFLGFTSFSTWECRRWLGISYVTVRYFSTSAARWPCITISRSFTMPAKEGMGKDGMRWDRMRGKGWDG